MTDREETLGSLEHIVLLAVMRLGEGAYGVTVRREIENTTGRELSLGAAQEVAANLGSPSSDGSGQGACPVGQLAAGIAGRAGSILDRFQLRCYQVTAAPE